MKSKILLLIIFIGCLPLAVHSQKLTAEKFFAKQKAIFQEMDCDLAYKTKDYPKLAKIYSMIIDVYNNQVVEQDKPKLKGIMAGNIYYNAACCYSILKKEKQAIRCFRKSIELGYKDVEHAKIDTDLNNIRRNKEYKQIIKEMERHSYLNVLREGNSYITEDKEIPSFIYSNPNDTNLVKVRHYFNLDSIAGSGDEISKIKNLMYWVHNSIRHDGSSYNPKTKNAIAFAQICKKEGRGINCRMMAIMLNECYMAMGWKSKYMTCMPEDSTDTDCHVINAVFSNTLNKWIWMDPTFAAYVSDERGNLLGLSEVRERLIKGLPLVLNDDANWNHKQKETKQMYLDNYMAKNLYQLECPVEFRFGEESVGMQRPKYIVLVPHGFKTYRANQVDFITADENQFWKNPY